MWAFVNQGLNMRPRCAKDIADAIGNSIVLQGGESLYAIVDGCIDFDFAATTNRNLGQPNRMLFRGAAAESMAEVAPYFVAVDMNSNFLLNWAERVGRNVGVLFVSAGKVRDTFRHLREIFLVESESGQEYFFRYYDPRVLRTYLPTCKGKAATDFFGPVTAYFAEAETTSSIEKFCLADGAVRRTVIPFDSQIG